MSIVQALCFNHRIICRDLVLITHTKLILFDQLSFKSLQELNFFILRIKLNVLLLDIGFLLV